MIPKKIFTIWLQESGEMPEMIRRCLESQKLDGYEFNLITLDNCFKDSKYMKECLESPHLSKRWCKASDYLRMHYLLNEGGIYMDADVEMLPGKNFDEFLGEKMFACREKNGWIGSAVIGAEKGHEFVKDWMDIVEKDFRGDDDKNFESSMEILNRLNRERNAVTVLPQETFFPYSHQDGTVNVTPKTICLHHFMKSWII